jgi:nucleoid DNA-binding protein
LTIPVFQQFETFSTRSGYLSFKESPFHPATPDANKINGLTKRSPCCETEKLAAFVRDPGWILDSQAHDPTTNASFIMNKVELVEAVQKQLGGVTSKAGAERAVTAVINAVKVGVKKDKVVQLVGFGTFKVVERKARKGINPKTLQQIRIPKSKTVKFVPGKDFKSKV